MSGGVCHSEQLLLKDIQSAGIYKERSGQDGFQGLMVRNFVTGLLRNFFRKMINFQFIPRAGMSF